jgi:hypothetical protein
MSVATELALIYGGDLSIQSNNDIQLSIDVQGSPEATYERVLRIILTNPITYDVNGNPLVRPDDLFHANFGSGARAAIGEPYTPALVSAVNARILAALASDPYVVSTPAPTVTWTTVSAGEYNLVVSLTSVTGQPFTLPAIPLSAIGVVPSGAQNG